MIKAVTSIIKGLINGAILVIFTITCAIPLYFFVLLKLCLFKTKYRDWCTKQATQAVNIWCKLIQWLTKFIYKTKIKVEGNPKLLNDKWYFIVCNHQSWSDIMFIEYLFAGKIPFIKFFTKDEFKYIPIIGIATWALDFPVMKRYSRKTLLKKPHLRGKDLETTQKRCQQYLKQPSSVLSFLEGTRITTKNHKQTNSPYKHLLQPKSAGFALAIRAMQKNINSIINVAIAYPCGKKSFVDFLCGNIDEIKIIIEEIPLPQNLFEGCYLSNQTAKQNVKHWLSNLWQQKDYQMQRLITSK